MLLVTFAEEIFDGKLHFLCNCSSCCRILENSERIGGHCTGRGKDRKYVVHWNNGFRNRNLKKQACFFGSNGLVIIALDTQARCPV